MGYFAVPDIELEQIGPILTAVDGRVGRDTGAGA